MKKILFLLLFSIYSISWSSAQISDTIVQLANYPLINDLNDITENNDTVTVANTEFKDGGLYSNGIYYDGTTNGSLIQTPKISNFNFNEFSIDLDIKIMEWGRNIIVFGDTWRWIRLFSDYDGKLNIAINLINDGYMEKNTEFELDINKWYKLGLSYKNSDNKILLFINDVFVDSVTPKAKIKHKMNFNFLNRDSGTSNTFKGYWKNLIIYNQAKTNSITELDDDLYVYPNPSNGIIHFDKLNLQEIDHLFLYDKLGKEIYHNKDILNSSICFHNLSDGIYYLKLILKNNKTFIKKIIINNCL